MSNISSSPRLVIMTFGSDSNKSIQGQRASAVAGWFSNPTRGGSELLSSDDTLSKLKVPVEAIEVDRLRQLLPQGELGKTDMDMLKAGSVASDQSWTLDDTLDTVVELRLRTPPPGGWPKKENGE